MQIKVFTLPVLDSGQMEEETNKFLRSHRVMTIDRQFTPENGGYWTLLVSYLTSSSADQTTAVSRNGKVDYREVLSPEEFGRFAHYRDVRKVIAQQQGIPAYAVFTDEELAQIARMEQPDIKAIATIKNVGKRAEKYGEMLLATPSQTPEV